MSSHELRQYQRQPVSLRLRLILDSGEIDTFTHGVSRAGLSAVLPQAPEVGATHEFVLYLPDGSPLCGLAQCRNIRAGNLTGFSIHFDDEQSVVWDDFIDQEEATGSLWRMLHRYASKEGSGDQLGSVVSLGRLESLIQPRGAGAGPLASFFARQREQVAMRLHTPGENGEAYHIAFDKQPSTRATQCNLVNSLPGFLPLAERSLVRVLDENMLIRLNDRTPLIPVRVCELSRGGYAYAQCDEQGRCDLVCLVLGEVILVEVDGQRMYPYFDDEELERIACDTVRHDIERPVFRSIAATQINPEMEHTARPESLSSSVRTIPKRGVVAVRFAQARAEVVQSRSYGERTLRLFPELWARARDDQGNEMMGPTMEDGPHVCLLALVGHRAPRVVRLLEDSDVELMTAPRHGQVKKS